MSEPEAPQLVWIIIKKKKIYKFAFHVDQVCWAVGWGIKTILMVEALKLS